MTDPQNLMKELNSLRKLDSEAAEYVETVIITRCPQFTGYPPYVGWKGLGLALNQRLDELEELVAQLQDIAERPPRPFQRGDTVTAQGSMQTWCIEHIASNHAWLRNEECPEGWGVPLHQVTLIKAADE